MLCTDAIWMTQEPNKCAVTKRFCKLRTADSVLMAMWDRLSACVCLNRISLMFWFVDWFSACLQASSSNMKKVTNDWRLVTLTSIVFVRDIASWQPHVYTWDAVTSVNLNISMVRNLRRHLVCMTDCWHEQEWWILMRWSCERHLFFDKVMSLGIDSCLYEIPNNDLVDDMKLWPPVTFPDVYCYLIETPGDFVITG